MIEGRASSRSEALRREDALALFRAGLEAVRPEPLVRAEVLRLLEAPPRGRIVVVGGGKAAAGMVRGAWEAFSQAWSGGWRGHVEGAVSLSGDAPSATEASWGKIDFLPAGHPLPDEGSVSAGRRMLALAQEARADDLVLVLLSGGASALLGVPAAGMSLDDLRDTTLALLHAGVSIQETNAVRGHLSAVAGGRLGLAAAPAPVVCLLISDVVGDDLAVIGSGPFYGDASTYADCLQILEREGVSLPPSVSAWLEAGVRGQAEETPSPGDPTLSHIEHRVLANNLGACRAMAVAAEGRGYRPLILSDRLQGEARELGLFLAGCAWSAAEVDAPLAPPCALLSGGEASVRVRGRGSGGRNQETVVSAIPLLAGLPVTLLSAGSDGLDGPTLAAGGLADGSSDRIARRLGLDPRRALEDNDSGTFLERLGDRIVTGPTGTNVADLRVVLISSDAHPVL